MLNIVSSQYNNNIDVVFSIDHAKIVAREEDIVHPTSGRVICLQP